MNLQQLHQQTTVLDSKLLDATYSLENVGVTDERQIVLDYIPNGPLCGPEVAYSMGQFEAVFNRNAVRQLTEKFTISHNNWVASAMSDPQIDGQTFAAAWNHGVGNHMAKNGSDKDYLFRFYETDSFPVLYGVLAYNYPTVLNSEVTGIVSEALGDYPGAKLDSYRISQSYVGGLVTLGDNLGFVADEQGKGHYYKVGLAFKHSGDGNGGLSVGLHLQRTSCSNSILFRPTVSLAHNGRGNHRRDGVNVMLQEFALGMKQLFPSVKTNDGSVVRYEQPEISTRISNIIKGIQDASNMSLGPQSIATEYYNNFFKNNDMPLLSGELMEEALTGSELAGAFFSTMNMVNGLTHVSKYLDKASAEKVQTLAGDILEEPSRVFVYSTQSV